MIDFACENDIDNLKQIWKICFKDDDNYINFYFDNIFRKEQTIVYRLNGRAIAMLRVFDCYLNIDNNPKVKYIYAVATLPEYQGQGIAKKIMEYAHQQAKSQDFFACVLIPQNENLFKFYSKLNYQTIFYKSKLILNKKNIIEHQDISCDFEICDFETFKKNRMKFLKNIYFSVIHGNLMAEYVYNESKFLGVQILNISSKIGEGYIVCYIDNDNLIIKETSLTTYQIACFYNCLINKFNVKSIEIFGVESSLTESSVKYGMIKILNNDNQKLFLDENNLPYMSLMLD